MKMSKREENVDPEARTFLEEQEWQWSSIYGGFVKIRNPDQETTEQSRSEPHIIVSEDWMASD